MDDEKPIRPVTRKHIVLSKKCLPAYPPVQMSFILYMAKDMYDLGNWPYFVIAFLWICHIVLKRSSLEWDLFHVWR